MASCSPLPGTLSPALLCLVDICPQLVLIDEQSPAAHLRNIAR